MLYNILTSLKRNSENMIVVFAIIIILVVVLYIIDMSFLYSCIAYDICLCVTLNGQFIADFRTNSMKPPMRPGWH